ncbi:probable lipid phosphate phosphatase beta [Nymphaea colorata]|nr:probable lipid phosphate phosphatase beta [Nymphaea colorata]
MAATVTPHRKSSATLSRLVDCDTRWSLSIHTACLPLPRFLLLVLEFSGDGRFWFPALASLCLHPSIFRDPFLSWLLVRLFAGCVLDVAIVGLIKFCVRRPRPVYNKGMSLVVSVDHWSFPSGHSSRACFLGSFLWLCSGLTEKYVGFWRTGFVGIVGLWSASTSFSRILLGRHFVFDVLAGMVLGVVEAFLVFHIGRLLVGTGTL